MVVESLALVPSVKGVAQRKAPVVTAITTGASCLSEPANPDGKRIRMPRLELSEEIE